VRATKGVCLGAVPGVEIPACGGGVSLLFVPVASFDDGVVLNVAGVGAVRLVLYVLALRVVDAPTLANGQVLIGGWRNVQTTDSDARVQCEGVVHACALGQTLKGADRVEVARGTQALSGETHRVGRLEAALRVTTARAALPVHRGTCRPCEAQEASSNDKVLHA